MKSRETLVLVLMAFVLVGTPAILLSYQYGHLAMAPTQTINIVVSAAESGGMQPDRITVMKGDTVTLRFTSGDLAHGIALGPGLNMDLGIVQPGQFKEVTLTFDHVGTITYYCNVSCSLQHWETRGVIDVRNLANPGATAVPPRDPVMDALAAQGVDIDARPAQTRVTFSGGEDAPSGGDDEDSLRMPIVRQSPEKPWLFAQPLNPEAGQRRVRAGLDIPSELNALTWRRSHTLLEATDLLASANPTVPRAELFDVTYYLWARDIQVLPATTSLYEKNCAICHRQSGDGSGPGAYATPKLPAPFSDLTHLADARGDVLYTKIFRGGNQTGMPSFGALFTSQEIWALEDYLWTFGERVPPSPK